MLHLFRMPYLLPSKTESSPISPDEKSGPGPGDKVNKIKPLSYLPKLLSNISYPLGKVITYFLPHFEKSYWDKIAATLSNEDIKYEILKQCDISVIGKMQQVSKDWFVAANDINLWNSIGRQMQLPTNQCDKENIKKITLETKNNIKNNFLSTFDFHCPSISSPNVFDIKVNKLASSYTIDDINTLRLILRQADKAKEVINFWNALKNQAQIGGEAAPQLDQIESIGELLSQAEGFQNWFQNHLVELSQLQMLDVSNNQLTSLPAEIGKLTQLQRLLVENNQLTSLPAEIGQLAQLQTLGVRNNQLTSLPAEIGKLVQLGWLEVSNNQLTSLPAEIGQLAQLQRLIVRNNQLTSLPAEIGKLIQLMGLVVSNNQLTSLPAEIGQLVHLGDLNVHNNHLTSLPAEIGQLAQLAGLDVSNNQLTSLPAEIGQLAQLWGLDVRNNQLTSLPAEIGQLDQLQRLLVDNN